MKRILRLAVPAICLLVPTVLTVVWVEAATARLDVLEGRDDAPQVAIASAADEGYCTRDLKKVLRRVLQSCGLLGSGELRGCKPIEAKNVATMSGDDFNALFVPLADRAGIIQFAKDSAELDDADVGLLDKIFADQRGASYFFVVARSSPEGAVRHNRKLSEKRAGAVLDHLRKQFNDPDLDREVGLLWLGEEFAQLDEEFCKWQRSGPRDKCDTVDLNRSSFVAWIDCRL
jgi:hypothetical protein